MAEETSDSELLTRARGQDRDAIATLYARHRPTARRVATTYARAGEPDDLVNEAFFRVIGALERGGGPEDSFRAYLLVTLRRTAMESIARTHDEPVAEVPEPVAAQTGAPPLDVADRQMIIAAYAALTAPQQSVLWQTAVEGRRPRELAPVLGMSANAVSAFASRARDRLREAYLQAHIATTPHPQCEPHRSRLGAFVRDSLAHSDRADTHNHVADCSSCHQLVSELTDVNTLLLRSLVPTFLGTSETGVAVAAAGAGGGAAVFAKGAGSGGLAGLRRLITVPRSNPGVGAGAVAATAVAVAGLAAALVGSPGSDGGQASPPAEAGAPADVEDRGDPVPASATRPTTPPESTEASDTTTPPPDSPASTTAPTAAPQSAPEEPPSSSSPPSTSAPATSAPATPPTAPQPSDAPTTTEATTTTSEPLPGSVQSSPSSTVPPPRAHPSPPSTVPDARGCAGAEVRPPGLGLGLDVCATVQVEVP
jgi:RNA polymerase sigma factor (sigma-70 family)